MFLPLRSKVWSVSLYDKPFSTYKVVENQKNWKCTESPWTLTLVNKNILHTLNTTCTYPEAQKLWSVSLYDKRFSRYEVIENGKSQETTELPQKVLELSLLKTTVYIPSTCPRGPNFCTFHSMTSRFKREIGNAPNEKYTVCTKYLSPGSKFSSVSLYNQPFSRYEVENPTIGNAENDLKMTVNT